MRLIGAVGKSGVESSFEAIRVVLAQLQLLKVIQRRQHDLGRKRQRRDHRPRRDGSVVGAVGHAARQIAKELPLSAADLERRRPGTVARGDAPAGLRRSRRIRAGLSIA